jgi:hypothetical protein
LLRRSIIAGLAAALAAPAFTVTPASAAILFTCPAIDGPLESTIGFTPGWSHTQTAQDASASIGLDQPCSNGEMAQIDVGIGVAEGITATTTYPPRPVGCPEAWGGAGPDYADQTPILLGATDPSFRANWFSDFSASTGIAKAKAGPTGTEYRLVFNITAGKYAPPAAKKTKIKLTVAISPYPGFTYTCVDDTDPLEYVDLASVGPVIVNQK